MAEKIDKKSFLADISEPGTSKATKYIYISNVYITPEWKIDSWSKFDTAKVLGVTIYCLKLKELTPQFGLRSALIATDNNLVKREHAIARYL